MKLYFDLCAIRRPFDDRTQPRVDREAGAVLDLVDAVEAGTHQFVWSQALEFENSADPDHEIRGLISEWSESASEYVSLYGSIERRLLELTASGLSVMDAAHLALAEATLCDVLITCDDRFMKSAARAGTLIRVMNPLQFVEEYCDG